MPNHPRWTPGNLLAFLAGSTLLGLIVILAFGLAVVAIGGVLLVVWDAFGPWGLTVLGVAVATGAFIKYKRNET